jgi:hypothetical protein
LSQNGIVSLLYFFFCGLGAGFFFGGGAGFFFGGTGFLVAGAGFFTTGGGLSGFRKIRRKPIEWWATLE